MNRLIAISGMALLAVCPFIWTSRAGAQPIGKLPPAAELSGGTGSTEAGEVPIRPVQRFRCRDLCPRRIR
jgi:hypothetical protein